MSDELVCWNCGESISDIPLPISRHANCSRCFEVLYCCRMCINFRPNNHIECDDERTDPPNIKENANFCGFFNPTTDAYDSASNNTSSAKSKLNALFDDDGNGAEPESDRKTKLDDLFDD